MVKTPTPKKTSEKTPYSAASTASAKHESPKKTKTAKVIVTAVKTSNNDKDLIAIKLGGWYTFYIKDVIKDICNNKGLKTHYEPA